MWGHLDRWDQCAVPPQWSNTKWHLHSQGTGEMWNHLYHLVMVPATLAFKIMSFCRQAHWQELHFMHGTAEAFQKQKKLRICLFGTGTVRERARFIHCRSWKWPFWTRQPKEKIGHWGILLKYSIQLIRFHSSFIISPLFNYIKSD